MLRFCGLVGLCTPPKNADDPNRREPAVTYLGAKCVGSGARGPYSLVRDLGLISKTTKSEYFGSNG